MSPALRPPGSTPGKVDALVTDGQSRAAVAGVRALARAGLRVLAVGPGPWAPALWSRGTSRRALAPASQAAGFAERIAALADGLGPLVIHPGQEGALDPLLARALPGGTVLSVGDAAAVAALRDKRQLAALALQAGLSAPATLAEGPAGALALDPPAAAGVVKSPGLSDALPAARLADDPAELRRILGSLPPEEPVVVQERLDPTLHAVSLVLDGSGRVVARLQQESRRTWPARAGASSVAVSVPPDEAVIERIAAMLALTGFSGLAQIQYLTGVDGPAVIDVNPRFYGSLPLALACGVNLPAAAQAVALGQPLPEAPPYRAGITYRWLEGDLWATVKGSRRHLRSPGRGPRCGAMWAGDDPVPSVLLAAQAGWGPFSARLRRVPAA